MLICLKMASLQYIIYETNSTNIRRFLDRGPYNIEWLMRKYLEVGFRSYKIEQI